VKFASVFLTPFLLLTAQLALAQPVIIAIPRPGPNDSGWANSPVRIEYVCDEVDSCPEPVVVQQDGANQEVSATVHDANGLEASRTLFVNIDATPPVVEIQSPAGGGVTTSPLLTIVATAFDVTSGLSSATCNGMPAAIGATGVIRCIVMLQIGDNDVVVEVSDAADNSGSAGLRIRHAGPVSQWSVIPEVAAVVVGSTRTFQVLDESGKNAPNVVWYVDDPLLAEVSADGKHTMKARAPGTVTLTATAQGLSASTTVTIHAGDFLPTNAIRWRVGSLSVIQTQNGRPGASGDTSNLVMTQQKPGQIGSIISLANVDGYLNWRLRPAVNTYETFDSIRELRSGGAAMVVSSTTGRTSSLIRGGPASASPWRYRSAGYLAKDFLVDTNGDILAIETRADRFPSFLIIEGATGKVRMRDPLPSGVQIATNVGCVKGANSGRLVPAQVGPLAPQADRNIRFELVTSDDREDFEQCGIVSGRSLRHLYVATVGATVKKVDLVRLYEVQAGAKPPNIELFPVVVDPKGGILVPWRATVSETNPVESKVMRISDSGQQEFTLPAVGKIWPSGRDEVAATTDGSTVAVFNMVTGELLHSHFYELGVKIVDMKDGIIYISYKGEEIGFFPNGRPAPVKR
jgi:Bacterial Ig-like domain (group 2)